MTEYSWKWAELPQTLKAVKFGEVIRKAKKIICSAYLGSGTEDLVWLVTTGGGNACAVKLASAIKPVQTSGRIPLTMNARRRLLV